MITVTESAAHHLRILLESKNASLEEEGLRLFVEKGGCAGMQYAMKVGAPEETDQVIEKDGVRVFVDKESLPFLGNVQLDYVDALNDSGFKIENPDATRSCGCGTSFEPAKKEEALAGAMPESSNPESCTGEED